MPLLRRKGQIAIALEATPGTAVPPTAGDAGLLVWNPSITLEPDIVEREVFHPTMSNLQDLPGGRKATITGTVEMKGSGTLDTAPLWGRLVQMSGFTEVITPTTGPVVWTLDSQTDKTATVDLFQHGRRYRLKGCAGDIVIRSVVGKTTFIDFTLKGVFDTFDNSSFLTGSTPEDAQPPIFQGGTFVFGSNTAIQEVQFKTGNTIAIRPDPTEANGYSYGLITARNPGGTIDPEATSGATASMAPEKWMTAVQAALSWSFGTTGGNALAIAAPLVQIKKSTDGDRDGISTDQLEYQVQASAPGQEEGFTITQT